MRNAIILHGRPDKDEYYNPELPSQSNMEWKPWLQRQLQLKDIIAQTPEIPMSFDPDYETWKTEFERYDITLDTVLVGHSCGAGFLVKYLSQHPETRVGKVVLVAPWLGDDYGDPPTDFFEGYQIDPAIASRTKGLTVFHSDNDFEAIQIAVKRLKATLKNANFKEFHGYGHFCMPHMTTAEFPELLDECLAGDA